jgi:HK97 family phage portal protein
VDGDGYPVYRVTLFPSEQVIWLSRFEIHHVWTVSNNGYTGLSPIEQQREAVGLALGAEEYGARMLGNGGVPAGVLEIPAGMNPDAEAAMRSTWKEVHEGSVSNAGKTAVLKGGAKYTPIGMKSVDIQWIEERKLQVEEICRIYGVPPALVQHTSPASSWGTGEIARYMGFLATTINPMLIASEQAMQRDLFTPEEFDQVWPQHNRAGLLATDLLTRYRSYAIGRQWGWLTANNILALEDMNPVGAEGDVLLDPTNMVRIPVDPTALLDAGGNGGGDGETATAEQVAVFLQKALTGGRGAAEGA